MASECCTGRESAVSNYLKREVLLIYPLPRLFFWQTHHSTGKKLPAHGAGKTRISVSEEQGGDNQYTATRSDVLRSVARKSLPCSVGGIQP
jgi:hypothetical protein